MFNICIIGGVVTKRRNVFWVKKGQRMNTDLNIGAKLKDLRNKNGLTQQELADRTELTKGYISQLENGSAVPSIMTLLDILECLGTNVADFFKESSDEQIVYKKQDYFEKQDEENGNLIRWLVPDAQKKMMEPIIVTMKEHSVLPPDKPHEGEEFGYVLKGDIKLTLGERSYRVKKGEAFYFAANEKHKIEAGGRNGAEILWISTPPSF